jgi:hypothetical protein
MSRKIKQVLFSPAEVDSIWNAVILSTGQQNNDDFVKEFKKQLRMRAMRKLAMWGTEPMEVQLATGPNYRSERWVAQEAADGSLVLSWDDKK